MKHFNYVSTRLFQEAAAEDKPADGGAAFDPAAFKAEILGEFNKTLNGFAKTFKSDITKLVTPKEPAAADPVEAPKVGADGKPVDPEKNALALELKTLKAGFEKKFKDLEEAKLAADRKADESERDSLIRAELGKYSFAPGKAAETAFSLVKAAVTRADDGSLVANDLPLSKWIETELPANHPYLLATKDMGSAGARPVKGATGKTKYTLADLAPATFMKRSPAEQAEIRAFIRDMA